MKKLTRLAILIFLFFSTLNALRSPLCYANNIRVQNVALYQSPGQPAGTIDIKFDVMWDNSFSGTDLNGQSYYDRAWVFVKCWNSASPVNTAWGHAVLTTGGTLSTYSTTTGSGISADGMGAFAAPGLNQTVRWNYTANGLSSTSTVKLRVMAIEMVLIPTGSFYVGSGGTGIESGSFTDGSWSSGATIPFKITSQGAITINTGAGNLWGTSTTGNNTIGPAGATNAAFPTGYNAFYSMKYEISQGQYVDFLNTLTREQQQGRIGTSIASAATSVTNIYVMANAATLTNRNTIVSPASITASVPIPFSTTTPHRASNWLSWVDLCAYADWSGLRPMTELEFEKASRGGSPTNNAVANEFAWGESTVFGTAYTLTNDGTLQEAASNQSTTLGNCAYSSTAAGAISGPLRCGIFANGTTSRVTSGASYYGVMELSGNVWERTVSVGEATVGRLFTGTHGNGIIGATGNATGTEVSTWPGTGALGSGFRGGDWNSAASDARVSDRFVAALTTYYRYSNSGGRCARTSP